MNPSVRARGGNVEGGQGFENRMGKDEIGKEEEERKIVRSRGVELRWAPPHGGRGCGTNGCSREYRTAHPPKNRMEFFPLENGNVPH